MAKRLSLAGQTFGRLTVREQAESAGGKTRWLADCSCGATTNVAGSELTQGRVASCGCLSRDLTSRRAKTHGMSRHPAFAVWRSMIDRCGLPTHQAFPRYGGRGIRVCERWMRFPAFWVDMGPTYQSGLTLERLDNDAGYSPENCAWRDRRAQARNTRVNRTIDTPRGPMLLCDAAEASGIGKTTLHYRFRAGWPAERMFDRPEVTNRA